LLFHLLKASEHIIDMHFMLQKEVVNRLAASPATSAYGKLSVMVQYYCHVEKLFDVAPYAFSPPPKVDSSMVRLTPHDKPPVEIGSLAKFEKVVSASFAQRRKTLRNNLKSLLNDEQLLSVDIEPSRRGETLSIHEFAALSNLLPD
jgi:16S rRNA (adenine1518-N6/adenine1519-N6)-dimethyltransferase